jgi:hypothetical protein
MSELLEPVALALLMKKAVPEGMITLLELVLKTTSCHLLLLELY